MISTLIDAPGSLAAMARTKGAKPMQSRIGDLPGPAVAAGSLAVLGGVTLRRLGIEFERAWLRSSEGPLQGESAPEHGELRGPAEDAGANISAGARRRWVSPQQSRIAPRATRVSR
jgi:hypothetical protein